MSKWSNEELKKLKESYEKGLNPKEISKEMDRSQSAIKNKAYKLKITTRLVQYSEKELNYIIENYDIKNLREIAEDLGRGKNYQNVCRKAKELGLTNKNRKKVRHKNSPEPMSEQERINKRRTRRKYDTLEEGREAARKAMVKWHKNNPHPKGMLGKTHSLEYRKRRSEIMKSAWRDPDSFFNSEKHRNAASKRMSKTMKKRMKEQKSIYSHAKGGTRKDLGFYVRSRWEANVSRYLKYKESQGEIFKWEYEPDTFKLDIDKKGIKTYTPDFKVWEKVNSTPYYIEVKGYMDKKSKAKMDSMKKIYSHIKINLIMEKEYRELSKYSNLIPFWEKDRYTKKLMERSRKH